MITMKYDYDKIDIQRFEQIAKYITGSVLDIGCRDGTLKRFLTRDTEYVGLDINKKYAQMLPLMQLMYHLKMIVLIQYAYLKYWNM